MKHCPSCGRRGEVIQTTTGEAHTTRRYRCSSAHRWSSVEIAVPADVSGARTGNLHDRVLQWLAQGAPT